jgi:hypothetical protein
MRTDGLADFTEQHELMDRLVLGDLSRRALDDLRVYFDRYTGRRFERFDGGGDRADVANWITSSDVLAVSLLSITWSPTAVIMLVEDHRDDLAQLLANVPHTPIEDVDFAVLSSGGAAAQLWGNLRQIPGIGPVIASKLLARKRPHLVPIFDKVIRVTLSFPPGASFWRCQWEWFHASPERVEGLRSLRAQADGIEDISLVRCLDVAVWMHGKRGS